MEPLRQILELASKLEGSPQELGFAQLLVRAAITFFVMFLCMRIAGRRFMAQKNPFDVLLAFLIASMMSRAINGTTAFWGTLALGFIIATIYRGTAAAACKYHTLGKILKGDPEPVVINGAVQKPAMHRHHVSKHDLQEDLRLAKGMDDLNQVRLAIIERNGEISVQRKPQIFDIHVEKGVQTIHLMIE